MPPRTEHAFTSKKPSSQENVPPASAASTSQGPKTEESPMTLIAHGISGMAGQLERIESSLAQQSSKISEAQGMSTTILLAIMKLQENTTVFRTEMRARMDHLETRMDSLQAGMDTTRDPIRTMQESAKPPPQGGCAGRPWY